MSLDQESSDSFIARTQKSSEFSCRLRKDMFQAVLSRSHEVCEVGLESFHRDGGVGERTETAVVESNRFGERPATAIEQVVEQVLRHLVQGTRCDRTADVLPGHTGSIMSVDDRHAG